MSMAKAARSQPSQGKVGEDGEQKQGSKRDRKKWWTLNLIRTMQDGDALVQGQDQWHLELAAEPLHSLALLNSIGQGEPESELG